LSNSFRHRRDFRQSRTHVVVKGIGAECFGGTMIDGVCVGGVLTLVHAVYTDHANAYPCRYLRNGWGGEPYFNAEIGTIAQAQAIATAIGDRAWGALGQLSWRTDMIPVGSTQVLEIEEGDHISLTNLQEGQNQDIYPVLEVTPVGGTVGHPIYEITVGERQPDFLDIISQKTAVVRVQEAIATNYGAGGLGDVTLGPGGRPGAPKDVPPTRAPTHTQRNEIQPQYNDTVGLTLYANPQDRDPALPVDPLLYQHPFRVTPPRTLSNRDPEPGLWASHDGEAHPYTVDFGYIATDGTYGTHVDYAMMMRRLSIKGTGTVTLQREHIDVAGPYTVSAAWSNQPISETGFVGIPFAAGDDIHVVVTGVGGSGISIKAKERAD
jgi:hypothetical protein